MGPSAMHVAGLVPELESLRCEVAHYPATDFTDVKLAERFVGSNRAVLMFGGPADQKADVIRLLSPVQLIKKDSTPVYCFHGDQDTVLSVENSRRLFAKGRQIGADIRYTEVQDGNHGFSSNGSPSLDEIITKASDFIITQLTK
jgi:predicted peptidase